jgi:hypothetical protein
LEKEREHAVRGQTAASRKMREIKSLIHFEPTTQTSELGKGIVQREKIGDPTCSTEGATPADRPSQTV